MAKGDFPRDPRFTAQQAAGDRLASLVPSDGPVCVHIPMVGALLDLDALRGIAQREKAERQLVEEIEMSVAGKEAMARTRFLASRSSGFPKSLDLAAFFSVSECMLADDGSGWRITKATFEDRDRRKKPWRAFDLETYVTHLTAALGMEGSQIAFRSIMSVLASDPGEEVIHQTELQEQGYAAATSSVPNEAHSENAANIISSERTSEASDEPNYASGTVADDEVAAERGESRNADVLQEVLHALSEIVAEPIRKDGRGYVTPSGQKIKLSMSSPYRGTDGRNFKVSPDHFSYDIFVIWKSEGGGGWAIPTGKLRDFLECMPMPNRPNGRDSWDPRIATEDGNDWLWTYARKYGRLDVSPYAF